jgi:hypothetical protein
MLTPMAPRVGIEVLDCRADSQDNRWQVRWSVSNGGSAAVALHTAWIPHGRFRGDGRVGLMEVLEAGDSTVLEFWVHAREEPGTRVDNAYLILQVSSEGHAWRIFARMRIDFDPFAIPHPIVEAITTQATADR